MGIDFKRLTSEVDARTERIKNSIMVVETDMVRAWCFADVATCREVSNPAWCRFFREISCVSPVNIETLFRFCVLQQGPSPSNASLESGVNEYLVGQR